MKTAIQNSQQQALQDRYGQHIAARLSTGLADLPYEITERLRAARVQALAKRKAWQPAASTVQVSGSAAALNFDDEESEGLTFWSGLASILPLLALAIGLVVIDVVQSEDRVRELAEVDAALLIDDLPPAAYTDPGFMQFVKSTTIQ